MILDAVVANTTVSTLGESPVWNLVEETVLWVDVHAGIVHTGVLQPSGAVTVSETIEVNSPVSSVAIAEGGG